MRIGVIMNSVPRAAVIVLAGVLLLSPSAPVFAQETAFLEFVKKRLKDESGAEKFGDKEFDRFCSIRTNLLAERVLFEYGSIFAASREVRLPLTCVFETSAEVDRFQALLKTRTARFGTVEIELQEEAMKKLMSAVEEASRSGLWITPLDGRVAGRRSYYDTVSIWYSRFHRALDHWRRLGKITVEEAQAFRFAPFREQAERVMKWESEGIYFGTDLSGSIFYSVAPPGTSQHLYLLAFDVVEAGNPAVRRILNKHGWFQTIRTDHPHFTFLGLDETELPGRGLQNILHQGNSYWVPVRWVNATRPGGNSEPSR